ncbi:MAG: sigma 54-interacting transcriptional regulator, partial [Thermoanaerobaculia bacterium]|nr:sigma 54-interacting transcriptional regulator [Thermoanaerobaculia bacterium]
LERVCAVLDPAAAVAVTRDGFGGPRALSVVGWADPPPDPEPLLSGELWRELLASGQSVTLRDGTLAGRSFREMLATPLSYRGVYLGFFALLDKERRGSEPGGFAGEDRRFLESVATLGAVSLDSVRQLASLEAQRDRLEEENRALKSDLTGKVGDQRIVANAPSMRRALAMVRRVAPRGVSVVLRGESGTGKELFAKLLHLDSGRSGPLVALNCSAIPETLIESELFGIESGVATGVEARRGKFELADGGTLFLDEIGDLAPAVQVRLLRALQEREVTPLGSQQPIPVDVRLVAATHRDLEALVSEGEFREDLYYRLKGVEITLPPLRERREEIPHLVRLFAADFCRREGIPTPGFPADTIAQLLAHDFPGNVRELQNVVEAAVSLSGETVEPDRVRSLLGGGQQAAGPEALDLKTLERRHIRRVLQITDGNKSRAASLLGIDRRTLQRKGF